MKEDNYVTSSAKNSDCTNSILQIRKGIFISTSNLVT